MGGDFVIWLAYAAGVFATFPMTKWWARLLLVVVGMTLLGLALWLNEPVFIEVPPEPVPFIGV